MNPRLTPAQSDILDYLHARIGAGMPPPRAEIARHFGFKSPNAVTDHLRLLRRKGFIELVPHTARGIRLAAP